MSLQFEERNQRVTSVLVDDRRVGVITERNGQIGYRIFGEREGGEVDSPQDAKRAFKQHFA